MSHSEYSESTAKTQAPRPWRAIIDETPLGDFDPAWWEECKARGCVAVSPRHFGQAIGADAGGVPEGRAGDATQPACAPVLCNTGAQTPLTECLVDYLRVTFPLSTPLAVVCDIFGGAHDVVTLPYGLRGYRHGLVLCPGVTVYHGGREDMGTHVEVTGSGCRHLEALGIVRDWQMFFARCRVFDGRFSRVDVAIDDRVGLLDMDTLEAAAWRGRAKGRQVLQGHDRDGVKQGHTIAFGSRQSETYFRIYDKCLEQRAKGEVAEGHWVRAEIELKGDRARAMADALANGDLVKTVAGVLRSHLVFVEPTADTHRERWPICDWWLRFLAEAEKVRLAVHGVDAVLNVKRAYHWLSRSAGPILAALVQHQQGGIDWLADLITCAGARMGPKHQVLARADYVDLARRPMPCGMGCSS